MGRRGWEAAERLLDTAEAEARFAFAGGQAEARSLSRACVAGEAVEVSQGHYARASSFEALPQRARAMRLIRAMARKHPEWVFAPFSAVLIHGLQVTNRLTGIVHLAMGARENRSIRDARIKCHLIRDESYELVFGIRVTPLRATVLDCLCRASFPQGLAIADSALHWNLIDEEDLRRHVERAGYRRRGNRMARKVLRWADGRSENGGESMARAIMIDLGFVPPDLQVEIYDPMNPARSWRVDFHWALSDGGVVVGELDGKGKYMQGAVHDVVPAIAKLTQERVRESNINLTCTTVLRLSFAEAMDGGHMRRLLEKAGAPMHRR